MSSTIKELKSLYFHVEIIIVCMPKSSKSLQRWHFLNEKMKKMKNGKKK